MRTRTCLARIVIVIAAVAVVACGEPTDPETVAAPLSIEVQPLSLSSISIAWPAVESGIVSGYRIQRRTGLQGEWITLEQEVPQPSDLQTRLVVVDDGLEPETFYGYRVVSFARLQTESKPSISRGASTPPLPAVFVDVSSFLSTPMSLDDDGYMLMLSGNGDTVTARVEPSGTRRMGPLTRGSYAVALSDVAINCTVVGGEVQHAQVTDVGLSTVDTLSFSVDCRDPNLGQIVAVVEAEGDTLPEAHTVLLSASLGDSTFVDHTTLRSPAGGQILFKNLTPSNYEVAIAAVPQQCTLLSDSLYSFNVGALTSDTARYEMECYKGGEDTSDREYVVRNTWSPNPAGLGNEVALTQRLDLDNAAPDKTLATIDVQLDFDPDVLEYQRYETPSGALDATTVNPNLQPGTVVWNSFAVIPKTGSRDLVTFYFTVIGSDGETVPTRTTVNSIQAADGVPVSNDSLGIVEDTLSIGSGGHPPPTNDPPNANAAGPYSGTVGSVIAFSASGSSDPDGTITSYSWSFGDGSSSTSQQPSHTYTSAGSYQVVLTVTDDDGATDSDTTQASVTALGNQAPVASAGGPYSQVVNDTVTFDGTGSVDYDGRIVSHSWDPGDGSGLLAGEVVSHVYTAPGAYSARLIVVDDSSAADTAQVSVTITDPSSGAPLSWSSTFGTVDGSTGAVALSIVADLTADLTETAGAEELLRFRVDSLLWNSAMVGYDSVEVDCICAFSSTPPGVGGNRIGFSGTVSSSANSGTIPIATLWFTTTGISGSMNTETFLALLESSAALGNFDYLPHTTVFEGALTVP